MMAPNADSAAAETAARCPASYAPTPHLRNRDNTNSTCMVSARFRVVFHPSPRAADDDTATLYAFARAAFADAVERPCWATGGAGDRAVQHVASLRDPLDSLAMAFASLWPALSKVVGRVWCVSPFSFVTKRPSLSLSLT